MADNNVRTVLQVCATNSNRLSDLAIKNGQLIFIQDKRRVAFDFEDTRRFYNQIDILDTDYERAMLEDAVDGMFYFVIETAMLWHYNNGWVQITSTPEQVVFIGTDIPELGSVKTLYVSKSKKEISVWDDESNEYIVVADKTDVVSISESDIDLLFA